MHNSFRPEGSQGIVEALAIREVAYNQLRTVRHSGLLAVAQIIQNHYAMAGAE
jgi:hypothetical protein